MPRHAAAAAACPPTQPVPLAPACTSRRQVAADYADRRPLVVGTLKGGVVFLADLVRAMDPPPPGLQLDFVRASSYGAATESSGDVALQAELGADPAGRHVLLVRRCCVRAWGLGGGATPGTRAQPVQAARMHRIHWLHPLAAYACGPAQPLPCSPPEGTGSWRLMAGPFLLPLPRASGAWLDTQATPNRGPYPRTLRSAPPRRAQPTARVH